MKEQIRIIPIGRTSPLESLPLKRPEIKEAITTLAKSRPAMELPEGAQNQSNSLLLLLPGEIRNAIYRYCLGVRYDRVPRPPGPYEHPPGSYQYSSGLNEHPPDPDERPARDDAFNLLQTCRQIYTEARSLLERTAVAYVPVTGVTNFGVAIHQINRSTPADLLPAGVTVLQALTNFWHVRFHLHTATSLKERMNATNAISFDREACKLFSRLRQALLIFTSASPRLVQARGHAKRRAVVHFDHYFALWSKRIKHHQRVYTIFHLINLMGRDTDTVWEIRFYQNTEFDDIFGDGPRSRASVWNELVRLCQPYEHVTPKMEIYGADLPEGNDAYEHTRDITPSSIYWSSWPEDVPWRK
ncbi:hypothetical protein K505DRAFT_343032 [Melanomma pulvis-pyrius CBS 109.77]|uniref:Uncharacterized protein n=1 Tax=Melanomma pulvis-pyrius CBS 109.77 TaxID=1314802 RepID=A0A6A6WUA6_9PLEO|nr:hypothetical protein K505DRAFT_343032 [Melanomma pulvis-pyrius CBS 109.77]